jgi:creatine kinase/arginine kinase
MSEQAKQPMFAKFLTPEVRAQLAGVKTASGFSIDDCVRSGTENPDSSIGCYAGDAECYQKFGALFDKVVETYHGYGKDDSHKRDLGSDGLADLDPAGEFVISTRIRVGRNLANVPLMPAISKEQRLEVERRVVEALATLEGDLQGQYYPLTGMDETVRVQLVADHFLFKKGDRFLESAGVNRDWPEARGIFHSADKRFLVWVNEEDQLRIISMQQGGGVKEVFERLARAIATLEKKLEFAYDGHLGYLSSCPTNLGTAMRASVHIKLPHFSKTAEFKSFCEGLNLSVRGIHGEHSESEGGVYDISNKQRLGVSENDAVRLLVAGVSKLIEKEKAASKVLVAAEA